MIKIEINTKIPYEVIIGKNILENIGREMRKINTDGKILVITDDIVANLYLYCVEKSLKNAGFEVFVYIFKNGERNKNIKTFTDILEFMAKSALNRKDTVIALGGGVVGDVAGFAASAYMRGVKLAHIPTTLLAATDSSIGGKNGINLKSGKNLAGTFYQPSLVLCDTNVFETLNNKEWLNGLAECAKYAILCGGEIFDILYENKIKENLERLIALSVNYKKSIVETDEKENHTRMLLNLGHTIGHAVEKLSDYEIPHGYAVAKGLWAIVEAEKKCALTDETAKKIYRLLSNLNFDLSLPFKINELIEVIKHDKKHDSGGTINIVRILDIGNCVIEKMNGNELGEYLYGL